MLRHINRVMTGWHYRRALACVIDEFYHDREFSVATKFLNFYVAAENSLSQQRSFSLVSRQGLGQGRPRCAATKLLGRVTECATTCDYAHSERNRSHSVRTTVHATNLRQCTVSCTV